MTGSRIPRLCSEVSWREVVKLDSLWPNLCCTTQDCSDWPISSALSTSEAVFFSFSFFLKDVLKLCVPVCICEWRCPWRPEESVETAGTGVPGHCELPGTDVGNWTQILSAEPSLPSSPLDCVCTCSCVVHFLWNVWRSEDNLTRTEGSLDLSQVVGFGSKPSNQSRSSL